MIILDEPQQTKYDPAGPTLRAPDPALGCSSSPLPDYATSQAQASQTQFVLPSLSRPTVPTSWRKDRRFWKAMLYAFVVYIVLSAAIGIPLLVLRLKHKHEGRPPPWGSSVTDDSSSLHTQNLAVGDHALNSGACNNWEDSQDTISYKLYTAATSHSFDPYGSLIIRSNASTEITESAGLTGNVTMGINPDAAATDVVFKVSLEATAPEVRSRTYVCFHDEGASRGLTVYVPSNLASDTLSLNIYALFPQSPISLTALESYLPMFTQVVGDMREYVKVDKFSLEGASEAIHVEGISSPKIAIKNALGGIFGTFNATEQLSLDTVGGPIHGNITLVQGAGRKHPTYFSLDTGNSEIDVNMTLQVTASTDMPFNFIGTAKTFNAPISIGVEHDAFTPASPLELQVTNNQAASTIRLDNKFSGTFDLSTKLAVATLHEGPMTKLQDASSGQVLYRNYMYQTTSRSRTAGWLGWGKRTEGWNPNEGHLSVKSSLSPIDVWILD
ncbi:hypothetical protein CYLTODRAFT_416251 [Cylindrobasidium torrendii FP15055 ss-10]|uniref:Uncharacterized protein n=1 Tax=Cylindrobasidium torrendii FP15055 ss-10 TaxID=1314674 RepID=A0A0D7BW01_9AGAR|nr:hypothetical protein CYLTODRAFT_416251 [Cylindrobasidium torrendii FP15055 ss-10]